MTIYDRPLSATRVPSPAVCLALLVALALGLLLLPERVAVALRQPVRAVLRPGLTSLAGVRERAEAIFGLVGNFGSGARDTAES